MKKSVDLVFVSSMEEVLERALTESPGARKADKPAPAPPVRESGKDRPRPSVS